MKRQSCEIRLNSVISFVFVAFCQPRILRYSARDVTDIFAINNSSGQIQLSKLTCKLIILFQATFSVLSEKVILKAFDKKKLVRMQCCQEVSMCHLSEFQNFLCQCLSVHPSSCLAYSPSFCQSDSPSVYPSIK